MTVIESRVKTKISGDAKVGFLVEATYKSDGSAGTYARIYLERGWLYIVSDDHEGAAMMHVELLPLVRRALSGLAKRLREGRA